MKAFFIILVVIGLVAGIGCKTGKDDSIKKQIAPESVQKETPSSSVLTNEASVDSTTDVRPETIGPALWKEIGDATGLVKISGKFSGLKLGAIRASIEELGGTVGTVTASIFTAECPASAITELAKMEGIEYLELSKTSFIKTQ